ncbi:Lar family restriction alleviation protein [Paenibacillus sp. HWE-109]|uniref:Lar family restriction alleviation protein n=1 Tax=Paenibacillus sp. HWE-109 TaxID=1306526 RepID=UPI003FCD1FEE
MNTVELKNCPFCGSNAERKTNKRYRKGYLATVGCKSQLCPAKISQATLHGDVEEAYKFAESVWNKRTDPVMEGKDGE